MKKAGIATLVFGVLISVGAFTGTALTLVDSLSGNKTLNPHGDTTVHLAAGKYTVYDDTDDHSVGFIFRDVEVTGPTGASVNVTDTGSATETVTHDASNYTGVAHFTAQTTGDYTISVASASSSDALVGKTLLSNLKRVGLFVGVGAFGAILFVAGLVLTIVGFRKGRGPGKPTFTPSNSSGAPEWLNDNPPS